MLFMSDLPEPELEQLGKSFIAKQQQKEHEKMRREGAATPEINEAVLTRDLEIEDRVNKSVVRIYL
jgi:ribosomal protein S25